MRRRGTLLVLAAVLTAASAVPAAAPAVAAAPPDTRAAVDDCTGGVEEYSSDGVRVWVECVRSRAGDPGGVQVRSGERREVTECFWTAVARVELPTGQLGYRFVVTCLPGDGGPVIGDPPGIIPWVETFPQEGSPARQVTDRVMDALDLTIGPPRSDPPGRLLVGVPAWLRVAAPASTTRRAAVEMDPGEWVDATARATRFTWAVPGHGTRSCAGPGIAWRPGAIPAEACTLTPTRRGRGELTVTPTWTVSTTGGVRVGGIVVGPLFIEPFAGTARRAEVVIADAQAVIG